MSQINPSNPQNDLDMVSRKLAALEADLRRSINRSHSRNIAIAVFGIITVLATGAYVGYAYVQFGSYVTPELVAENMQGQLQNSMPQLRDQLQENLKTNAPKYVEDVLNQLQDVPTHFADQLHEDAEKKIDDQMPEVQKQLYDSMKATLDQSQKTVNSAPGSNDEQRFQAMLDALGKTYGTETIKFVDQVHTNYSTEAVDFTSYLDYLAQNQNLDQRDQLYRKMFRTVFMLVRAREKSGGQEMETPTFQPAAQ